MSSKEIADTFVFSQRSTGRETRKSGKMTLKAVAMETMSVVSTVEMAMTVVVGIQSLRTRPSSTTTAMMTIVPETTPSLRMKPLSMKAATMIVVALTRTSRTRLSLMTIDMEAATTTIKRLSCEMMDMAATSIVGTSTETIASWMMPLDGLGIRCAPTCALHMHSSC